MTHAFVALWGEQETSLVADTTDLSHRQIIQLFFSANDSDSQIAEYSVLQMAQRQISFEQGNAPAKLRRPLPPRRHLRS